MTRIATLEVERMTDRALWGAALGLVDRLNPRSLLYEPAQARYLAPQLHSVLLELKQRGIQLSLLPPAS